MKERFNGFTLVELAIVIVIIGLLVGGVLQGRELIKAAQMQGSVADVSKIATAIITFKDKYKAIPGDMTNAFSVFPNLGCLNEDVSISGAGCNGNGNRQISERYESLRLWQHLVAANLYNGSFTGVAASNTDFVPNRNVPPARMDGGGYTAAWRSMDYENLNWITLATTGGAYLNNRIMTPQEAMSIDIKQDDGFAGLGRIKLSNYHNGSSWTGNCVTGANENKVVLPSSGNLECIVLFKALEGV